MSYQNSVVQSFKVCLQNEKCTLNWLNGDGSHFYLLMQLSVCPLQLFAVSCFLVLWVNSEILLSSLVSRLTSASSECLTRERGVFCSYWVIPLHPNTSRAALFSPTPSKCSMASLRSSSTVTRSSTKSVRIGSRLGQLFPRRANRLALSHPETWREGAEAHRSTRRSLTPGRRLQARLPKDPWLQTCSYRWSQTPAFSTSRHWAGRVWWTSVVSNMRPGGHL